MRPSNKGLVVLIIALAGGFLFGLWMLFELRFSAGDIYPTYSSLRADPLGTKALYESLAQVPGFSTSRNYRDITRLPKGKTTVLLLRMNPFQLENLPDEDIKEYETLATGGARVVIAMRPVSRPAEAVEANDPSKKEQPMLPAIEKRWRIHFGYITRPGKQNDEDAGANLKQTALYFRVDGKVVHRVERQFGSGTVALLANCYPFSNEAMAGERDIDLLAWAIGPNRQVIFDEQHLGLAENGGVVTLARKYHLEGLAAVLLVLLGLFVWRNSTSLLPPRPEQVRAGASVAAKDATSGLANLLRRNIPAKALIRTCVDEWESSRHGGKLYSQSKIDRVHTLAVRRDNVVETYREVSQILSERSET